MLWTEWAWSIVSKVTYLWWKNCSIFGWFIEENFKIVGQGATSFSNCDCIVGTNYLCNYIIIIVDFQEKRLKEKSVPSCQSKETRVNTEDYFCQRLNWELRQFNYLMPISETVTQETGSRLLERESQRRTIIIFGCSIRKGSMWRIQLFRKSSVIYPQFQWRCKL